MSFRSTRVLLAGAALLASSGVAALSGAANVSATTATSLTFAYDWPSADMELIPVVVAQHQGFFAAQGLHVKTVFPPNTSTTAKLLATGTAQVGFITTTDMAAAINEKVPLLSVANYSMSNNWGLFTKPGVKTPLSSLKGKTVFSYGDTWTTAMLPFVFKKAGVTASQVKVVSGSSDIPLLLNGKINFSTSTTNYEIPGIVGATGKQPGESLVGSAVGVPNIPIWNYAVAKGWASGHSSNIKKFLLAIENATKWAIANPAKAVSEFEAAYPKNGYTHAYNTSGWNLTIPLLKNAQGKFFVETNQQWITLDQAMKATGQLKSYPGPSAYYTNQYQP